MDLRAERAEDAGPVAQLHGEAFGDHGARVAALVEQLRATIPPDSRLSIVASVRNQIVGHVMFSRGFLDAARSLVPVQILSPLAVASEHRRRGVGAALVSRGLEVLTKHGVPAIFLEGDPAYYGRLGFVAAVPLGLQKPSDRIPDAAFQVLTTPAHEAWMTGTLVYPEAFWLNDSVGLREESATAASRNREK